MALKYRFNLKDIKLADFKVYLLALFKGILPKKKIKNIENLQEFIQKRHPDLGEKSGEAGLSRDAQIIRSAQGQDHAGHARARGRAVIILRSES